MNASDFFLIKDLSHISGHSIYTLKYYLKIGLIKESGRSPGTGFRYFSQETVNDLKRIRDLQKQGKSLKEIKEIVK